MGILQKRARIFFTMLGIFALLINCHGAFEADNTITLSGKVTDKADSQPINNALIQITEPPQFQQSTRSDSTGAFRFEIESKNKVALSITAKKESFEVIDRSLNAESGTDLSDINFSLTAKKDSSDEDGDGNNGSEAKGAAGISLKNEPPQAISIAETGNTISTPFTFQVTDSAGQALSTQKAVEVKFKLLSSPGGKERLVPSSAVTDGQGTVTTTLYSGNKAGEVKLQAVTDESEMGFSLKSSPVLVAIHGGFPDANHFSMSRSKKNIEGFVLDNKRVPFSVILGDKFSNPVKPGTIIYFESTGGVIQGSAKTDEDGTASIELISGDPRPKNGQVTVTASTVNSKDERIQQKNDVIFSTSKAAISTKTPHFDLQPGESQNINFTAADLNGNPMAKGTVIKVESDEGIDLSGDTDLTLGDYLTPGKGHTKFQFTIRNAISSTDDQPNTGIMITVESPSGQTTAYKKISGKLRGNPNPSPPAAAAAIELVSPPKEVININATGEGVSTSLTFQVQDESGNPLSDKQAVPVKFKLTNKPNGNEHLVPEKATTNAQGEVTTKLVSGNKAGVVQIQASLTLDDGNIVTSKPVAVSINGGFPDEGHFDISSSIQNIDANDSGNLPTINVTLGDQFSNPVKPGTAISFRTNGGIIQGSANTDEDGKATVSFTSLKPRAPDGKVMVTASTVGADNQSVKKQIPLVFSTPQAKVKSTPTTFELKAGASQHFQYSVTDHDGNPMAKGTVIKVESDEGIDLTGDTDLTLGDYLTPGKDHTKFQFTLTDTGQSEKNNIDVQIIVVSPTGRKTIYDAIKGKRIIKANNKVGAAAIVLAKQPKDFININETGDEVSAPFTFQVQDSLGRPLKADNAVDVQFELVSSPGGGEEVVPDKATTDASGNATTTLFSGNKAGEVKVQALVERPEVGLTIKSSPVLIAIHGGFPDKGHFSIAPDKLNFEGFNKNNERNTITVVLGDEFSNPVKPGTVVYFETTGGVIKGSGKTDEDGVIEVDLISGDPRPANGLATVTASTVNKNNVRIQKTLDVVFSTSQADISATPTTPTTLPFDLCTEPKASFSYTVADQNGNPMPAGTQISIDAGQGIEVTGDANFTLGDFLQAGSNRTTFNFSIRDTDQESNDQADLTITITVTTPSGNTTTYSDIQGSRC